MPELYEDLIDVVTLGGYTKLKKRISVVEKIISSVMVTKEDVETKISEAKITIKKEVDDRIMKLASIDAMMSLAQGLNKRMDNILDSVSALKKEQDTKDPAANADLINGLLNKVTQNTSDIAKNQSDVIDLKQVLAQIVPQVVAAIDPKTLSSLVETIVTNEINAINSTAADSSPTDTNTPSGN